MYTKRGPREDWRNPELARRRLMLLVVLALTLFGCDRKAGFDEVEESSAHVERCVDSPGRLALSPVLASESTPGRLEQSNEGLAQQAFSDASQLLGTTTVFVFWSVWCDTCGEALDDLDVWLETNSERSLNVIAINSDGEARRSDARDHALGEDRTFGAYFVTDEAHSELNPRGYTPTICVADIEGVQTARFVGYSPEHRAELFAAIERSTAP